MVSSLCTQESRTAASSPGIPAASPPRAVAAAADAEATAADWKRLRTGWGGWPGSGRGLGRGGGGARAQAGLGLPSQGYPSPAPGRDQGEATPLPGKQTADPAGGRWGKKAEVIVAAVTKQEDTRAGEWGLLRAALHNAALHKSPGEAREGRGHGNPSV